MNRRPGNQAQPYSRTKPDRRSARQASLVPGAVISTLSMDAQDPSLVHVRIGRRSAAKISADAAAALGLAVGIELDDSQIVGILHQQSITDARYWAYRALSRRGCGVSKGDLKLKLQRKGIPAEIAQNVINDLERRSLLDDERYARALVSSQLARTAGACGQRLLEAKLRSKRIDPQLARQIVREALQDQQHQGLDPRQAALDLAKRKARAFSPRVDSQTAARRLLGLLARRGFEPHICADVARTVAKTRLDPSDIE